MNSHVLLLKSGNATNKMYYYDTISVLYITSLSSTLADGRPGLMPSPTHQILQKAGKLGMLVVLAHQPLIRQSSVRLSWKTACSESQTARGHSGLICSYRSRTLMEGFVSQTLGVGEGNSRKEVQCK